MTLAPTRPSIVLLESSDQQAKVQMNDGDTFFVTVTEAARACRALEKVVQFKNQFNELIDTLTKWIEARRPRIRSAMIKVRSTDILLLIVQKQQGFDQQLVDELVDLDIEIASSGSYDLIDMSVLCIPAVKTDACSAFLSSGDVYTHADQG